MQEKQRQIKGGRKGERELSKEGRKYRGGDEINGDERNQACPGGTCTKVLTSDDISAESGAIK